MTLLLLFAALALGGLAFNVGRWRERQRMGHLLDKHMTRQDQAAVLDAFQRAKDKCDE